MPRHFLDLSQIDKAELRGIIDMAKAMKASRAGWPKGRVDEGAPLSGHVVILIFEKASTRTRASFDVGVRQLGGEALSFAAQEMQLGRGETVADTAQVLSRYGDAVMIRARSHKTLIELASASQIPVINGLTDRSHPCQLMADVLTFEEHLGPIKGRHIAWLGDGNNVATSLIEAAAAFDFRVTLGCPETYAPDQEVLAAARDKGADVTWHADPVAAISGADAVMTDTWVSMGQDEERAVRLSALAPYQVNRDLMAHAKDNAIFMHCLPAHRGEEVSADVLDGARAVIWDQAENRLHAQKAIIRWCLNV